MWGKKWPKKENKYGNKKVKIAGHSFDSMLEGAVYQSLLLRERAGEISELVHHPGTVFLSLARVRYEPDFRFRNNSTGELEYAEAKGNYPNHRWPTIKRLWKHYGPSVLYIYMGEAKRFKLTQTIVPKTEAA